MERNEASNEASDMLRSISAYHVGVLAAVGLAAYSIYNIVKAKRETALQVLRVDTNLLRNVREETMINNLFLKACQTFSKILEANNVKATQQVASTCYSLYKQIKEGDADEFERNKTATAADKYQVWLQQVGKDDVTCKKEYICLVAQLDAEFSATVNDVVSGKTKDIKVDSQQMSGGLEPPSSQPIKPDNTEYLKSLTKDERTIDELYSSVTKDKDETLLLNYMKAGRLTPTSVDKMKQTPLMIAVENSFSESTISQLVVLGCDVNTQNSYEYTPLHAALMLEDEKLFRLLLRLGADPKIKDNEDLSVEEICRTDYPDTFHMILGQVTL